MKKKILVGCLMAVMVILSIITYIRFMTAQNSVEVKTINSYEVVKQSPLHLKGQVQSKVLQTVLLSVDKGPIKTIHVKEGDHVSKDTVLVTYEWGEKIKADRDSIVTTLNEDAKNDPTKPLMVLNSSDSEIKGIVTEYDKEKLANDMEVTIQYVSQNKTVPGKITSISEVNNNDVASSSNNATGNVVNYNFIAQPNEAIPLGYSVEVLIPRNEIHLPMASVEKKEELHYVYVIEGDQVKEKEVLVKEADGYYLLESGIEEGSKIAKNTAGLKDGMDVIVQ